MSEIILAHIPAREGSKRVPVKNLRSLAGQPLICHSIQAARGSRLLTDFYVNTESARIAEVALSQGAKVFRRSPELAQDDVTLDIFNHDFICKNKLDVLVLVNPVCPLVTSEDIDSAIRFFKRGEYDAVASVTHYKLHSFLNGQPINFDMNRVLQKTQDLKPVQVCNWAIHVWRAQWFREHYEKNGYACFSGKLGLFELPAARAVKISDEADFLLAERVALGSRH